MIHLRARNIKRLVFTICVTRVPSEKGESIKFFPEISPLFVSRNNENFAK